MKKFKIIIIFTILLFLLTISTPQCLTYTDYQEVKSNGTIFYLVSLNKSETLNITCSSKYQLNYSLFVFNFRPTSNYKNPNGIYSSELYNLSITFYEGYYPELNFIANKALIYYIQIIVHNASSNLITIYSNKELGRYYLPLIDSYPLEIIGVTTIFTISTITFLILKKRKLRV
ncbi:MAG: hypothetical protein KAX33_08765 [Candidatus Lokiarchaeota archaeon]|nr:hypothetical protein [Candidatus Lokiarchaeota archaeon]